MIKLMEHDCVSLRAAVVLLRHQTGTRGTVEGFPVDGCWAPLLLRMQDGQCPRGACGHVYLPRNRGRHKETCFRGSALLVMHTADTLPDEM